MSAKSLLTVFFFPFPALFISLSSCEAQVPLEKPVTIPEKKAEPSLSKVQEHYRKYASRSGESVSSGSVSSGSLKNGYLLPFSGSNYHYFDTTSYLANRGFMHLKVRNTLLSAYARLESEDPGKSYGIMECSHEHGGKLEPHRTHQNGLSVDFMTPLLKDGKPYPELDFKGVEHYFMNFGNDGKYSEDKSVTIDFERVAQHLLIVMEEAGKQGLVIDKIIWKVELQDELFATPSGKKLRESGVYVTRKLTPLINSLHDDHYHVDFKIPR